MFMRLLALVALSFAGLCNASASLADDFKKACAVSRMKGGRKLSNEERLKFYGWYKIATIGPLREDSELPDDAYAEYKIERWEQMTKEGVTAEQAMTEYIALMDQVRPEWRTLRA